MFRGLGKVITVAVVAGVVGAAIGVGLAHLTGSNGSTTTVAAPATVPTAAGTPVAPVAPPPAEPAPTTQTQPTPSTTTTTAKKPVLKGPVPRVQVLSAQIGKVSATTGNARLHTQVSVTNRYAVAIELTTPKLISDQDRVPLDAAAHTAAGPLLGSLAPGTTATGTLRFTVTSAVAQRLLATARGQLRIAGRTVQLKVTAAPSG